MTGTEAIQAVLDGLYVLGNREPEIRITRDDRFYNLKCGSRSAIGCTVEQAALKLREGFVEQNRREREKHDSALRAFGAVE